MNRQAIFDTVAGHLLAQAQRALDLTGPDECALCAYRIESGGELLKGSLGVIIPDSLYGAWMEGKSIGGVLSQTLKTMTQMMRPWQIMNGV
jgi:hypothetical protein